MCIGNVVVQKQAQKLTSFLIACHRGFKTQLYRVSGIAEQIHLMMHRWCKVWKFFNTPKRYKRPKANCSMSVRQLQFQIFLLLYVSLEFPISLKELGCLIYFVTRGIHHSNLLRVLEKKKKTYIKYHLLCFYLYNRSKCNMSIIKMLFKVSVQILVFEYPFPNKDWM